MSAANDSPRRRLTVAMIVRDEADLLPDALRSVQAVADEIVVADTGSSDQSSQIAAAHGARVVSLTWNDDFAAARNQTLEHVQGDWILWLDAGERLDAEHASALRQFVDQQADAGCAYLLMIQVPPETPEGEPEQVARVRLVPNRPDLRFEGRVRESLHVAIAKADMRMEMTPWCLHRTAAEHDIQRKRQKAQRNMRLAQLEHGAGSREPRVLLTIGDVYAVLNEWPQARRYYREAIQHAGRGSTEMLEGYYGLITAFGSSADDREAQLGACVEATAVFPFDAQLLCAMGSYLQAQGRMDLACRSYEAAHRYGQVDPQAWHLVHIGEVASLCFAISLDLLGKTDQAEDALRQAIERHPDSEKLHRYLLDLLIRRGDPKPVLDAAKQLPFAQQNHEALRSALRGACQAAKKNWIPAMAYLETAYRAGCRDPICLRWLAVCLVSTGNVLDAEPVLRQWQEVEPHHPELRNYLELLRDESSTQDLQADLPASVAETAPPPLADTPQPAPHFAPSPTASPADQQPSEASAPPAAQAADRSAAAPDVPGVAAGDTEQPAAHDGVLDHDTAQLRKLRIDSANNPLDGAIHFRLGATHRKKGDLDAAEQVWRNYLARCPNDARVARSLAELLLEQDRLAEAIELVGSAGAAPENQPLADLLHGIQAARSGQWATALGHFEASRAAGYDRPVLFEQMADCLIALGRQREAEPLLRDLVRIQPNNPTAYERLARFLNQNGRPDEARALRRKARQLSTSLSGPADRASALASDDSTPIA